MSFRANARVLFDLISAAAQPDRPLVANLVVTRRCNLSCGYCFEYDDVSPPVPLATLQERIDHLARLRTVFVTLTGGEPLLHPDIAEVVAYVRARGMTPVMNTNGFLLSKEKIEALAAAGLYAMQVSVDNVTPNETTMKSLKPLLPKLKVLAEHAAFKVRINSVLGSGPPEEALEVARAALELGFDTKCSLMRDARGEPVPLDARAHEIYQEIQKLEGRAPSYLSEDFQLPLLRGDGVDWKCRAGARFFHVCENGLVHWCAPRTGNPGKPLADYTVEDIRRAFHQRKWCASRCPVPYAHQASRMDAWRPQSAPSRPGRLFLPVVSQ